MKVAVLGPIGKDYVTIHNETKSKIGSIVYYTGVALKNLGINVAAFAIFNTKDKDWIEKHFKGIPIWHIPDKTTLTVHSTFSEDNPDVRTSKIISSTDGAIEPKEEILKELEEFDWIILGPLSHANIPYRLVEKLKHKNIIYGNFGIFSAIEDGKWVAKYPEKLVAILPHLKYVFLDVNEAAFVSGKNKLDDIALFFKTNGLKNLILTSGSKGSFIFSKNKKFVIPSFPPKQLIDPTGAGDSYLAGFVKALELYDDSEKQGRFAAMVATISLEKSGAFDSRVDEVLERLSKEN